MPAGGALSRSSGPPAVATATSRARTAAPAAATDGVDIARAATLVAMSEGPPPAQEDTPSSSNGPRPPPGRPSSGGSPEVAPDSGTPGLRSGVPSSTFESPPGTPPYVRPSGAGPTAAQRRAVQGRPCVDCGATAPRQVADHRDPLVVQHYREGSVDVEAQSRPDAVQPHCPDCSASQGGQLGAWARRQRRSAQGE